MCESEREDEREREGEGGKTRDKYLKIRWETDVNFAADTMQYDA